MSYAHVRPSVAAFGLGDAASSIAQRILNLEAGGIATPQFTDAEYNALMAWWFRCDREGQEAWRAIHRTGNEMPRSIYAHMWPHVTAKMATITTVFKDLFGNPKPAEEQARLRANAAWHSVKDTLGCPSGAEREKIFGFVAPAPKLATGLVSSVKAYAPPPAPPTEGAAKYATGLKKSVSPLTAAQEPEVTCPAGAAYDSAAGLCVCPSGTKLNAATNACEPTGAATEPEFAPVLVTCPEGYLYDTELKVCVPPVMAPTPSTEAEIEQAMPTEAASIFGSVPWWGWLVGAAAAIGAVWYWQKHERKANPSAFPMELWLPADHPVRRRGGHSPSEVTSYPHARSLVRSQDGWREVRVSRTDRDAGVVARWKRSDGATATLRGS